MQTRRKTRLRRSCQQLANPKDFLASKSQISCRRPTMIVNWTTMLLMKCRQPGKVLKILREEARRWSKKTTESRRRCRWAGRASTSSSPPACRARGCQNRSSSRREAWAPGGSKLAKSAFCVSFIVSTSDQKLKKYQTSNYTWLLQSICLSFRNWTILMKLNLITILLHL